MRFFYMLAMLGSLIGGLILVATLTSATGAPQEASGAALAVAFAVLPYVFARSVEAFSTAKTQEMIRSYLEAQPDAAQPQLLQPHTPEPGRTAPQARG